MAITVTTTGLTASVTLNDLGGRVITHAFSGNFEDEFKTDSIIKSSDLQLAIDNGFVTVSDPMGQNVSNLSNLLMFQSSLSSGQGITYSTTGIITVDAEASEIPFTAATPSNWSATQSGPSDVKEALDDIAFRSQLIEDGGGVNTDAQTISSATSSFTTSAIFGTMSDMILTTNNLVDRQYLILFSATFNGDSNRALDLQIIANGVPQAASLRTHKISSGNAFSLSTQNLTENLADNLIVSVHWRISGGTINVSDRSLIIYSIEGGVSL